MSTRLRTSQCCVVKKCLSPAKELGDHCSAHWRGLSPARRSYLIWQEAVDQPTEPIDSVAIAAELVAQAERFTARAAALEEEERG